MMTIPYEILDSYKPPEVLVEVPMSEFVSIMSYTPRAERPEWLQECVRSGMEYVVLPAARIVEMRKRIGWTPYPRKEA